MTRVALWHIIFSDPKQDLTQTLFGYTCSHVHLGPWNRTMHPILPKWAHVGSQHLSLRTHRFDTTYCNFRLLSHGALLYHIQCYHMKSCRKSASILPSASARWRIHLVMLPQCGSPPHQTFWPAQTLSKWQHMHWISACDSCNVWWNERRGSHN